MPVSQVERSRPSDAERRRRRLTSKIVRRRRAAAAGIVLAALATLLVAISTLSTGGAPGRFSSALESARASGRVRIELDGQTLAEQPTSRLGGVRSQAALAGQAPATTTLRRSLARITLRTDRQALAGSIKRAVAAGGGIIVVPRTAIASSIRLPVIKQTLQDDCEATALSMMLSFQGKQVDQLTLQRQLARSGPLDPEQGPAGEIWGDPRQGFVGRADGGGPAGGFGVYQGPIAALARKHGVRLRDLSQKSPQAIYRTLLAGRPVMVWVALTNGPYASWHSPSGKFVRVNYGEHTVVLSGVRNGEVTINDPLSGQRLTWPKSQFEAMWGSLGSRALAAQP